MNVKYKLVFNDHDMQESITYTLVTKFNLEPNILKAEIDENGGMMIIKLRGKMDDIENGIRYLNENGTETIELNKHISRIHDVCIDCGSCISVCPAKAFTIDQQTWEVHLDFEKCIACGTCLTACPTHAIDLTI